ncbi:hypothetical protein [Halococcus thailandensis]|uniref:hypothetical protein n=1 Tax=Halococcus thailandensis TaxID=335952 RepID=UPI00137592E2|nr:hypothetical protein [Halococcus thailandensis]
MSDSTEHESKLSVREWGATWGSPSEMIQQWIQRFQSSNENQQHQTHSDDDSE